MRSVFFPVMKFLPNYAVLDLRTGPVEAVSTHAKKVSAVGRFNEKRLGLYTSAQYQSETGVRDIHMGLDLIAPPGSHVYAIAEGRVYGVIDHGRDQDYGPTLIVEYFILNKKIWSLHGHLSRASLSRWKPGMIFPCGQKLATIGENHENGGWFPHLHWQFSLVEPKDLDMPGVVSEHDLSEALRVYPDPRQFISFKLY